MSHGNPSLPAPTREGPVGPDGAMLVDRTRAELPQALWRGRANPTLSDPSHFRQAIRNRDRARRKPLVFRIQRRQDRTADSGRCVHNGPLCPSRPDPVNVYNNISWGIRPVPPGTDVEAVASAADARNGKVVWVGGEMVSSGRSAFYLIEGLATDTFWPPQAGHA
jgi:hypothetical protein